MEFDLIKNNYDITPVRRRKIENPKKSIFEIYKSEKTMKDYLFYLNDFLSYIFEIKETEEEQYIKFMLETTETDVENYLSHLIHERKLKKTSINKIMSGLKSLYAELERIYERMQNGEKYKNPFRFFKKFKTGRNLDNILKLSFEDIQKILDKYSVYGEKEYRNTVIFYTLFYTGMRSQELLDLKYKNILKRDSDYFIKLEKTKSRREQYKPLHEILVEKLKDYKEYIMKMYNFSEEDMEERYVFPSFFDKNTRLTYNALYNIIQNMGKTIGTDISPHNIRHAVATELSANGADILEIRDFLGHADTRVTEIYINAKSLIDKKVLGKIPTPIK